jgi:hypothetical protein
LRGERRRSVAPAAVLAISGEGTSGSGCLGARRAAVQPRGGVGEVDLPRELAGTRLDGGGHGGRRRSKEGRGGEAHTA